MKHLSAIYETIRTEGWAHIKAQIQDRINIATVQLVKVVRPEKPSDDALRGLISGLNWIQDFETRVTHALEAPKEADSMEQPPDTGGIGSPMEPDPTE